MTSQRTLPLITPENAHFWRGGANDLLQLLRCRECCFWIHPPSPICPQCHRDHLAVEAVSGRATVVSFTVNHQQWRPALSVPYVIAIVELVEQGGLRLTTNIVDVTDGELRVGLPVHVVFEQDEDVWLPLFAPDEKEGG